MRTSRSDTLEHLCAFNWSAFKILLVALAFVMRGISIPAAPVNDYFTNAIAISGTKGTVTGDNVFSTSEPGEPRFEANDHYGRSTVWYKWRSGATRTIVEMNTFGSIIDTVLGVYTGTNVSNLQVVAACDDYVGNFFASYSARVFFEAAPDTDYSVQLDSWAFLENLNQGPFTLNWKTISPRLDLTMSGTNVVLSWDILGWWLEASEVLAGESTVWNRVTGAPPVTLPANGFYRFFRVSER